MSSTTKTTYKLADKSNWPIVSKNEYASMITQIAAGLLASGHYTQELDLTEECPGYDGLLKERDWREHYQPCVIEPAEMIVNDFLTLCALQTPECEEAWEEKDTETDDSEIKK
jgi:hypothetical protein